MEWTDNNILLEYKRHSCRDIFKAVCDEIGMHYTEKGYKYSRSRPKIKIENELIKLEISFWSSGRNIPGEYVNLEILPHFYSKQLKESRANGFIIGHVELFTHKYTEDKTRIRINQIYGDVLETIDEYSHESTIKDNFNCNIYGIDKDKFMRIINFIDSKIIYWFNQIQNEEGIIELIKSTSESGKYHLKGEASNSNFIEYVKLNYPKIDIETMLGE
jgi:hypothetical protein